MSAGELDIEIDQGASFALEAQVQEDNATAFDLTGCTATASAGSFSFTCTITSPTDGTIVVSATPAQTAALVFFLVPWHLDVTLPDTTVIRVLAGECELLHV